MTSDQSGDQPAGDPVWDDLTRITRWLDAESGLKGNPEADTASRIMKIGEEYGEAVAAWIGMTGQNPRKRYTHSREDVLAELADVAVAALCAMLHLTTRDQAETTFRDKITAIMERVPEIKDY